MKLRGVVLAAGVVGLALAFGGVGAVAWVLAPPRHTLTAERCQHLRLGMTMDDVVRLLPAPPGDHGVGTPEPFGILSDDWRHGRNADGGTRWPDLIDRERRHRPYDWIGDEHGVRVTSDDDGTVSGWRESAVFRPRPTLLTRLRAWVGL